MADLTITSLRGGMNDTDPPSSLAEDQCVLAENVEFVESMLGERRKGSEAIDLTSASLTGKDAVTFLYRHTPSEDETAAELWALGVTFAGAYQLAYKDTAWHTVTPVDAITVTGAYAFTVQAQSLHGKLFLAYKSAVDRLHVWDGTTLRAAGVATPSAPTAADAGVGTFSGKRYYRVRYIEKSGSTVLRRSEPSDTLTFTPSGTGASVTVTRPALLGVGETHWEIEASLDNANFYAMATIAAATTTHSDSVAFNTGYRASGTLSEDAGDYTVIPSVRYLATDGDRLLCGGSYEDAATASDVIWTPVTNDPGDGNDERIPIDTDNRLSLDGRKGGDLTGLSNPVFGYVYATKLSAIYRLVRSGQRAKAYEAIEISGYTTGAVHGSLVQGVDAGGNACLYALDPKVGPIQIGLKGIQRAGKDIRETWKRLNIDASRVVCRALYYPDKLQVHWWIAVDSDSAPSMRIILQTNETRMTEDGVRRGWSIATLPTGTHVYAACLFADNVDDNAARSLVLKPVIGTDKAAGLIQLCDTGDDDDGDAYAAQITTRPIAAAGILNEFGIHSAALLATAAADVTVNVSASRDYGLETMAAIGVDLDPTGTETHVIKAIDDFAFSELKTIQVVFADPASPAGVWQLHQFAMRPTAGQAA